MRRPPLPIPIPHSIGSPALWSFFLVATLALLAVDLAMTRRRAAAQDFRSAASWSAFWIVLSLLFGSYLWQSYGREPALEFFAGYVLEKSLSVDNLFVFVLLFRSLAVPSDQQHRVLFWGVLGALVLRGALIGIGVELVRHFHWVLAVFGLFLVIAALRLALGPDEGPARAPTDSWLVRWVRRRIPMTAQLEGGRFLLSKGGKLFATPLLLAVVAAESADLIFALDSIPAVFAVTSDPFLVFSSNVCALLGLRALYFVVQGALVRIRYLRAGLSAILLFMGSKLIAGRWVRLPTGLSLAVIAAILAVVLVSSWARKDMPSEGASGR